MKRVLVSAAVIALVISAVSCKKCVNCEYQYVYLDDTVTVQYSEQCGSSKEIKDFKISKEAEAKRYGTELTCEDAK